MWPLGIAWWLRRECVFKVLYLWRTTLRASSPGRSCCWAEKGRRACNFDSGIWMPPPIPPWLPLEWAVRFPPISAKQKRARMYVQTLKNISTNQHFPSTFSMQIFKFHRRLLVTRSLSFLFPPRCQSASESLLVGYWRTWRLSIIWVCIVSDLFVYFCKNCVL